MSPNHPIAAAAMGRKIGDSLVTKSQIGEDRHWEVVEIKHKYLYVLHDVLANFEQRFPNANGFYTVNVKEGDIQPVLEQVRRTSEAQRKLADLYLAKHVPLNMVATLSSSSVIEFTEYILLLGHNVETWTGIHEPRLVARSLIAKQMTIGAVLDAYAAWTAAYTKFLTF